MVRVLSPVYGQKFPTYWFEIRMKFFIKFRWLSCHSSWLIHLDLSWIFVPLTKLVQLVESGHRLLLGPGAKSLDTAQQFFTFARAEWSVRYKPISESWINLLQPSRSAPQNGALMKVYTHAIPRWLAGWDCTSIRSPLLSIDRLWVALWFSPIHF